jgi:NAD(P)-dependent dehydrogenase (short-subunit alcohol dehydrogenase family)
VTASAHIDATVLISAGASGIGRAIAENFLARGARVHVCDISKKNIQSFLQANPGASATLADVSDDAQLEQVFADLLERHGGLDVLINNAGVSGPTAPVDEISLDQWQQTLGVCLNGAFFMTRRGVPFLRKSSAASIVNISSTSGLHGSPLRSAYAASKWALIGLTKTWAMDLGPAGIRVNAVCPGSVEGSRIDRVIEQEAANRGITPQEVRDTYLRQSSMRKFVSADDVAKKVVFLASDDAASVSGQAIAVDGHTEGLSNWLD